MEIKIKSWLFSGANGGETPVDAGSALMNDG